MENKKGENMLTVKYRGAFIDGSGYAQASRNAILGLDMAGVELTTEHVSFMQERVATDEGIKLALRTQNIPLEYDTKIVQLTPNFFLESLEPNKYMIGNFFWEVMGIDPLWVWHLNRMDEIWISSYIFAEMLKDNGVRVPIKSMPCGLEVKFPKAKPFRLQDFIFYSIFQWTERKNPKGLIQTFWRTFEGKNNVCLVVKTYGANFSLTEQQKIIKQVAEWKAEMPNKHFPKVYLALQPMTNLEVARLHETGDVFISAHRGEGWGMPQMEAMAHGNPIISTGFGGIHEWLAGKVTGLVPYKLVNVFGMEHIQWYNTKQLWAEPDYKAMGDMMFAYYKSPNKVEINGNIAREFVQREFSLKNTGEIMRKELDAV